MRFTGCYGDDPHKALRGWYEALDDLIMSASSVGSGDPDVAIPSIERQDEYRPRPRARAEQFSKLLASQVSAQVYPPWTGSWTAVPETVKKAPRVSEAQFTFTAQGQNDDNGKRKRFRTSPCTRQSPREHEDTSESEEENLRPTKKMRYHATLANSEGLEDDEASEGIEAVNKMKENENRHASLLSFPPLISDKTNLIKAWLDSVIDPTPADCEIRNDQTAFASPVSYSCFSTANHSVSCSSSHTLGRSIPSNSSHSDPDTTP
ncbi:hypothetical protein QBC41DRAFT_302597 [Cercophora samala]|uniref:Uncharacterized protein n=1 Tax=Cercophora samala TaxID=330535 RepID=A0AA39ZEA3_9PEZI|nr:hypothetical protein QBC41DRAFT_302597 [Cercophora samala]